MVFPDIAVTTSPGFMAVPLGMLVVEPITATTLTARPSRPIASIAPITPAAPHMSNFMCCMPSPGLRLMPPVSKQSPLPTSTIGFASPPRRYSTVTSLGSCGVPCATLRNEPIPSSVMPSRPSTVVCIPKRSARSRPTSAKVSGVQTLPGIIASRRASA
jgi:hypothetical protein